MTQRTGFRDFLRSLTGRAPESTAPAVAAPPPPPPTPAPPKLPEPVTRFGKVIRRSEYFHTKGGMYDFESTGERAAFAVQLDGADGEQYYTVTVHNQGDAAPIREGDYVKTTDYGWYKSIEVDWQRQQAARTM